MNRDEAIEVLREHAREHKPSYYAEPFQPHEWAIQAVLAATSRRVLACVYCGRTYPMNTPAAGSPILTEHIRVCEKHPLRAAEDQLKIAREALEGLVGVSTREDLLDMQVAVRAMPAPEDDPMAKVASLNAIHALLVLNQTQESAHG